MPSRQRFGTIVRAIAKIRGELRSEQRGSLRRPFQDCRSLQTPDVPWLRRILAREELMGSALRLLPHDETRALTLTGLPGVGTISAARNVAALHSAGEKVSFVDARRATHAGALARLVLEVATISENLSGAGLDPIRVDTDRGINCGEVRLDVP